MINPNNRWSKIRSVAVIGSGLAGLTSALLLQQRGIEATIFEKSRGPGGRLSAKRVEGGSVDMGAQYFTIRNPEFNDFLRENAGADAFAPWDGRFGYQKAPGRWESFPDEKRYVGVPRMTAISRALSENARVVADTRIGRLSKTSEGWTVTSVNGDDFGPFDAVIITAPPAQARDLLAESELPELAAELDGPVRHVQPCWAVAAHFEKARFDEYDGMRVHSDILSWVANNSSKPGREDNGQWWVLHATAEWSAANVDTSAEVVSSHMLNEFRSIVGAAAEPTSVLTHRWLYAKSDDESAPGFHWFAEERIGLAGDWLDGGRVEGAFNSASALVQALATPVQ